MSAARRLLLLVLVGLAASLLAPGLAAATEGGEGEATWASEQPRPPQAPPGQPQPTVPIGLGRVGDIEFWAPNRGLLITAGNGSTVPAGVWAYNGVEWHEIATQCGAAENQDGRIAWAGPNEFWTVSTGRPGQRSESTEITKLPPLIDNTLCHFKEGQIVASYAHPAFSADSYLTMHAATCFDPSDCWFGGEALEEPQTGGFQLHWNGSALESSPYPGEGHAIEDLVGLEGSLFQSVRLSASDRSTTSNPEPPVIRRVNPEGIEPTFEPETRLPLYGPRENPNRLDYLHLSAADGAVWAAGGRKRESAGEEATGAQELGQLTVLRRAEGNWTQLIGPDSGTTVRSLPAILPHEEEQQLLGVKPEEHGATSIAANATVSSIAAEPGSDSAWLALRSPEEREPTRAVLVHISAEGHVLQTVTLPSAAEEAATHIGPKGAAAYVTCPGAQDCWLTTTQGWVFHLAPAGERTLPQDERESEYFRGLITYRPSDLGLPQVPPDAPPPDTSGLLEEGLKVNERAEEKKAPPASNQVTLPLLSHMRSRLLHGDTLELSFHLSVKARMRLVAKRHSKVVAATRAKDFKAGNGKLMLRLNRRSWPTKLSLQARALAPLPVVSSVTGQGANVGTESTGVFVLTRSPLAGGSGFLP